uniref:Uncharacterized protein n=1 Tax=Gasterosteus aculeatus aculeatus TaxID=481459 RepID=A0AAQ4PUL6_GASAC
MTLEASFRALEAFISPSAAMIFLTALRGNSNFTSLISTRSTLIPHRSVASSRDSWENIKSQILQSYKTLLVMLHSNNYKMRSSTPEVYVALWPS